MSLARARRAPPCWVVALLACCTQEHSPTDAGSRAPVDGGNHPPATSCPAAVLAGSWRAVALADFDGDGRLDLALASTDDDVTVLSADAGIAAVLPVPHSLAVAAADLDGDGVPDLLALHDVLTVWRGGPGFSFGAPHDYPCGAGGSVIVTADFDRDGHLDVAVVNESSATVSLLHGLGDGTLGAPVAFGTGFSPSGAATADFNRDGWPDLAIADFDTPGVSVLLGDGDGGFAPRAGYSTHQWPLGVAVGDFELDGAPDIAVAMSGAPEIAWLRNHSDGGFTVTTAPTLGALRAIVAADVDGDGDLDLLVAHYSTPGTVGWLENRDGGFAPERTRSAGVRPAALAFGAIGGEPTLVIADDSDGGVLLMPASCF